MGVIGSETIHGGNTGSGQSMGLPDSDVGVDVESCSTTGATAEKFGDVEVHKVGVVEDDRLDAAFDLLAFVAVGGDHVHDFCRHAVLVGYGDAAEWMPQHLAEVALDHIAIGVLVELQGLAAVGQQRAGDEHVTVDGNVAGECTFKDVCNDDALTDAGVEVLDEGHLDVTGQQRELHGSKFVEGPSFATAAGGDGFIPGGGHLLSKILALNVHEVGKEFGNFGDAVGCSCGHGVHSFQGLGSEASRPQSSASMYSPFLQ